jgi:hypothetical protein
MFQGYSVSFDRILTMIHIMAKMPSDEIVASDTTVTFIPLAAVLIPQPMMWLKEHFCNFSVLQRVHLSNLIRT